MAQHGQRAVVRGFVVLAAPGEPGRAAGPRLGVTVSKRVGNAVVRNRVKRRIREWFRAEDLDAALDYVVIGRRAAAPLSGTETQRQLHGAVRQLGALPS